MKRILFVVNTWGERGAEQQLMDLRRCLPEDLHSEVFVFSRADTKAACVIADRSIKECTHEFFSPKNRFAKSLHLLHTLIKNKYDVVVTEGLGSALFFGRLYGAITGVSAIYSTLHTLNNLNRNDDLYFEPPNHILNRILPRLYKRRVFRYLTVLNAMNEKIRSQVRNYAVQTLWNAIPRELVNKDSAYRPNSAVRIAEDKIAGHPTVIQIGTLDRNKNQIFTLRCVKKIKEKVSNIRCLIVGDGPERDRLSEFIKNEGLEDYVLLTGQIERMDCLHLIGKSNVLVMTSFSEAFPVVFLEAMAYGIPIVSFDVGGASDVIKNNDNGFLTSVNAEDEFQDRIVTLLADPQRAKAMGLRGKQFLYQDFNMEKKTKRLINMIDSDLSRVRENKRG